MKIVFVSDFGPRKTGLVVCNLDVIKMFPEYSWIQVKATGVINILLIPLKLLIYRRRTRYLYATISDNYVGFLKDVVTLLPAKVLGYRVVAHSHSGSVHHFIKSGLLSFFYSHCIDRLILLSELFKVPVRNTVVIA
ncbi:MAG: hypothetical protein RIB86_07265, partial [Imperialibacter sp.]